jgi:hypothetical protein
VFDSVSKTRGEYGYALVDIEGAIADETLNAIADQEGVYRVRRVK